MNKITVYGRLTEDVKKYTTQSGKSVANVRIASNGRNKDDVSFFECKAFNGLADTMEKYMHKGDPIVAYGSMHQFKYQAQDGASKTSWELLIDDIDFVPKGDKKPTEKAEPVEVVDVEPLPF